MGSEQGSVINLDNIQTIAFDCLGRRIGWLTALLPKEVPLAFDLQAD
jgi:mRNA-degrading endonuclease toxin of MazEF toxin-antitoxin module